MSRPFRLQSLLDYRRQLEDEQSLALAEVAAEERRVREAMMALERQREEQTAALRTLVVGGVFDAEKYTQRAAFLDVVGRAFDEQAAALEEATMRVVERRQALVEALTDRRVLERLRDRQAEAAAIDDGRHEARDVDDMVMARHQRAKQK